MSRPRTTSRPRERRASDGPPGRGGRRPLHEDRARRPGRGVHRSGRAGGRVVAGRRPHRLWPARGGAPREPFPFLGSSALEEPLNRYRVTVAFHGHAHRGAPEGRTSTGIPVFNVAMPLLRRTLSETLPVRILEIPAPEAVSVANEP